MSSATYLEKLKSLLFGQQLPPETGAVDGVTANDGVNDVFSSAARLPSRLETKTPTLDYNDPRIPKTSQTRVDSIRNLMIEIERQASMTTAGRDALEEARRIEKIYLPQLLNSYFDIGEAHRVQVFRSTGKSASFLLNDRLDTLISQLTSISQEFAMGRIDAFSLNLGFIDQRFDTTKSPFDSD